MLEELFRLLDVNATGALEEDELARLRAKVSVLRRGAGEAVCTAMRAAEEWGIPVGGQAMSYNAFREYVLHILDIVEPDVSAQEMILQQFVRSSRQARAAPVSLSASGPLSTVEEGLTPVPSTCSGAAGFGTLRSGGGASPGSTSASPQAAPDPSRAEWRSAMRLASKDSEGRPISGGF
jgi:hypothetical protein